MLRYSIDGKPFEDACFSSCHEWPAIGKEVTITWEYFRPKDRHKEWWERYIEVVLDQLGMGQYVQETSKEAIKRKELTFDMTQVSMPGIITVWNFFRAFDPYDYGHSFMTFKELMDQFPENSFLTNFVLMHYVRAFFQMDGTMEWTYYQRGHHSMFQRWTCISQVYHWYKIHRRIKTFKSAMECPTMDGNLWAALGSPSPGLQDTFSVYTGLDGPLGDPIPNFPEKVREVNRIINGQASLMRQEGNR